MNRNEYELAAIDGSGQQKRSRKNGCGDGIGRRPAGIGSRTRSIGAKAVRARHAVPIVRQEAETQTEAQRVAEIISIYNRPYPAALLHRRGTVRGLQRVGQASRRRSIPDGNLEASVRSYVFQVVNKVWNEERQARSIDRACLRYAGLRFGNQNKVHKSGVS